MEVEENLATTTSDAPRYDAFLEYDQVITDYYSQNTAIQELLLALADEGTGACLDLGCGAGINGPLLRQAGFKCERGSPDRGRAPLVAPGPTQCDDRGRATPCIIA